LPPLRERREDIPLLAQHFLERQARRYRKPIKGFSEDAAQALLDHPWPGNIRELKHAVERSVLLARDDRIRAHDLGLVTPTEGKTNIDAMTLDEVEKILIEKALQRYEGNVSQAADALGLSRSALYRRLQRHGL
jgi:DNA-binding NtrC family response regulator